MIGRGLVIVATVIGLAAPIARAQPTDTLAVAPSEPPPESPEGADYTIETADTLADGSVELGFGAAGRGTGSFQKRKRVRFSGDGVSGSIRDGSGDPLAGGGLEGRLAGGTGAIGRLAPRWGRGLVLGAPGDPWQRVAHDRGGGAGFRGRSGEGVSYRRDSGEGVWLEGLGGRFARRDLFGVRAGRGGLGLGVLAGRRRRTQASLALGGHGEEAELAMDARGRWRAGLLVERPVGEWRATTLVSAGSSRFRSLAEPSRGGAARALAVGLEGDAGALKTRVSAASWRFQPGVTGSRLALEVEHPLAHHSALAAGFEEQHGTRRGQASRAGDVRQGLWVTWRSPPAPLALALRHESWGERAFARGGVRAVSSARVEARGPWDSELRVTHWTFGVRRGESLYVPESESDRLVLRSLAGRGRRTRFDAGVPVAGGQIRAGLGISESDGRRARPQWTLDWSRRARTRT